VFGTGVYADSHPVDLAFLGSAVLEPDDEGGASGHDRPAALEELARSGRVSGLKRNSVFVQDENGWVYFAGWVALTGLLPNRMVRSDATTVR
jgi:hypothetical protein